jgi:hypothetical protein
VGSSSARSVDPVVPPADVSPEAVEANSSNEHSPGGPWPLLESTVNLTMPGVTVHALRPNGTMSFESVGK